MPNTILDVTLWNLFPYANYNFLNSGNAYKISVFHIGNEPFFLCIPP